MFESKDSKVIQGYLDSIINKYEKILFFFSGHGSESAIKCNSESKLEYLDLKKWIKANRLVDFVFIFECCHGGNSLGVLSSLHDPGIKLISASTYRLFTKNNGKYGLLIQSIQEIKKNEKIQVNQETNTNYPFEDLFDGDKYLEFCSVISTYYDIKRRYYNELLYVFPEFYLDLKSFVGRDKYSKIFNTMIEDSPVNQKGGIGDRKLQICKFYEDMNHVNAIIKHYKKNCDNQLLNQAIFAKNKDEFNSACQQILSKLFEPQNHNPA